MTGKGVSAGGRTGTVRNPGRYCTATAKQTGARCTRYALTGESRCKIHLGRAPDPLAAITPERVAEVLSAGEHGDGADIAAVLLGRLDL